ncbi:hypothetical protein J4466_05495 [Candidatus Pacearchaeota archaeon]|nr:hypothetical protein [Candidatus Pacearchaeota archaeon]
MKFVFKPTIKLNIEKKYVLFLFMLVAVSGIALVIAQQTTIPLWNSSQHPVWHDASDIRVKINNTYYDLQTAIDYNLTGSGGTSTTIVTGGVLQTFAVPAGSEEDYTKECSECKQIVTNLLTGERQCCTGFVGPVGHSCFGGSVVPIDRNKFVQYNQNITLNPGLVIESGKYYEFSCTYGTETSPQINIIQLNETEQVIARNSEPHFVYDSVLPWVDNQFSGSDNFAFYVYTLNGDMTIRVKNVEQCQSFVSGGGRICGAWRDRTETTYAYDRECVGYTSAPATTRTQCTPSTVCPTYYVPSGLSSLSYGSSYEYYAWKSLRCTIKAA